MFPEESHDTDHNVDRADFRLANQLNAHLVVVTIALDTQYLSQWTLNIAPREQ